MMTIMNMFKNLTQVTNPICVSPREQKCLKMMITTTSVAMMHLILQSEKVLSKITSIITECPWITKSYQSVTKKKRIEVSIGRKVAIELLVAVQLIIRINRTKISKMRQIHN